MRDKCLSYDTIARTLGISKQTVAKISRRHGRSGFIADLPTKYDEEVVADIIRRSGFEYVTGYNGAKKNVTIRCLKCGRTFDRLFKTFSEFAHGTLRHNIECPLCRYDKMQEQKRQCEENLERDARIKAEQQAMKQADLISRQTEERLAIHVCKNCGKEYCIGITGYNSNKYCSEKCMKRWAMRIKNDRRLKRMKTRRHDTDITLEKLFGKDAGVCYLCGKLCDWAAVDCNGNAQDNYPSIDHVIPLSRGGLHTWANVRLAHRGCNTAKGASI